ncbi:MerR family transcriptional regulator [Halalkalibaculum sp. DA3122]|uniref:MerR family transcriptional regulator n=1 Tax=unclassified Halalkalibaculum TaxID=2964617 RepID=UPI003754E5F1
MEKSTSQTYKIGEVARRADVNRETVRYYERRELIDEPDRRRSGYRIFTQKHIDQIKFIKRAQELGFTLSEIKELLALRIDHPDSCEEVQRKTEAKLKDVRQKIEDLKRIRTVLRELIDSCKGEGKTEDCVILRALEGENETGQQLR